MYVSIHKFRSVSIFPCGTIDTRTYLSFFYSTGSFPFDTEREVTCPKRILNTRGRLGSLHNKRSHTKSFPAFWPREFLLSRPVCKKALYGNACYAGYRLGKLSPTTQKNQVMNKTKHWFVLRSTIYYRGNKHLTSNNLILCNIK